MAEPLVKVRLGFGDPRGPHPADTRPGRGDGHRAEPRRGEHQHHAPLQLARAGALPPPPPLHEGERGRSCPSRGQRGGVGAARPLLTPVPRSRPSRALPAPSSAPSRRKPRASAGNISTAAAGWRCPRRPPATPRWHGNSGRRRSGWRGSRSRTEPPGCSAGRRRGHGGRSAPPVPTPRCRGDNTAPAWRDCEAFIKNPGATRAATPR